MLTFLFTYVIHHADSALKKRGVAPAVFFVGGYPRGGIKQISQKDVCTPWVTMCHFRSLSVIQTIHFKPCMTFDNPRSRLDTRAWKVQRGPTLVDPIWWFSTPQNLSMWIHSSNHQRSSRLPGDVNWAQLLKKPFPPFILCNEMVCMCLGGQRFLEFFSMLPLLQDVKKIPSFHGQARAEGVFFFVLNQV